MDSNPSNGKGQVALVASGDIVSDHEVSAQDVPATSARPGSREGVEVNPNSAGTANAIVASTNDQRDTPISPRGDLDAAVTNFVKHGSFDISRNGDGGTSNAENDSDDEKPAHEGSCNPRDDRERNDTEKPTPDNSTIPKIDGSKATKSPAQTAAKPKWAFPGDGNPRQSDRLTVNNKPACAYDDCPKQSQGRRLNFMCMAHFKSITGGKMITPISKTAYDPNKVVPAEDVGKGWTVLEVPRIKAKTNGEKTVDKYWFSPIKHHRFRSRVEIERFFKALEEVEDGDEDAAWELFRKGGKKDSRSAKGIGDGEGDGDARYEYSDSSSDEDDTSDWICDNCGAEVPGSLSRCKCYRWRNGIHPMMKKKFRRQREQARARAERSGDDNEDLNGGYWDKDESNGGDAEKVPRATTTRSGRKSGRRKTLADEQAKAAEAPTKKRQRGAKAAVAGKEDTKSATSPGKGGVITTKTSRVASPTPAKARKRVKSSAKARRDSRKREAAEEEEVAAEEGKVSDSFHATMLRAVNEAPNPYAQALAAAAFDAAGGDAWLREHMAKQTVRTNVNLQVLGMAPIPPAKILSAKEDSVKDVLEEIVSAVEARDLAVNLPPESFVVSLSKPMGITLSQKEGGGARVSAIKAGSPADVSSKVKIDDTLLAVNGKDVRKKEFRDIFDMIGKAGPIVDMLFSPDQQQEELQNHAKATEPSTSIVSEKNTEKNSPADDTNTAMKVEHEVLPDSSVEPLVEDPHWNWDEAKQISYRQVLRISVKDPHAKQLVTDARISGIPVVLTDHVGWAGFAARWLRRKDTDESLDAYGDEEEKKSDGGREASNAKTIDAKALDLSDPSLYLDIEAMAEDIGEQEVPVIKKSYDDTDPIAGKIPLSLFLRESWPSRTSKTAHNQTLYLHQWQFPLNEAAGRKLCHQSQPLPNSIFGEDLHKYWLDRVPNDCPLQYLFMGNEETMSRMHKDPGGLAITIAPIVGEKQCVLVHRDDGNTCLYHLEASVDPDNIDLDAYPLLANARIWRTTVKPGEILLMPQGTYHQCRNVKSCLSYSRFHLDEVNLPAFLQSLFDGDATELLHDEVIWNAVEALMKKVDKVTDAGQDQVKNAIKEGEVTPLTSDDMRVSEDIYKAINALRSLRHVAREIARKLDLRETVKGVGADEMPGPSSGSSKIEGGKETWFAMVEDIDYCLHEFRYRFSKEVPPLSFSRPRGKKRFALPSTLMKCKRDDAANITVYNGYQRVENSEDGSPILAFSTDIERGYILLSKAPAPMTEEERLQMNKKIANLSIGETIMVTVKNKMCDATVMEIRKHEHAAYISYEAYPGLYDEYLPSNLLRQPIGGKAEVPLAELKPGKVVIGLVGDKREEYRGNVKFTKSGLLIRAKLNFRAGIFVERWIDSDGIVGVGAIQRGRKRKASLSDGERSFSDADDIGEDGESVPEN